MTKRVLCLRPEADFTRVDAEAPRTLEVAYRGPADADVPGLMKASDALVIPAVGPKLAPDLFGAPVAVPAPGEYVAIGAARQAAWALTGGDTPPRWEVAVDTSVDPVDPERGAQVCARYADVLAAAHPRRP